MRGKWLDTHHRCWVDDYKDAAIAGVSVVAMLVMLPFVLVGTIAAGALILIDRAKGRL